MADEEKQEKAYEVRDKRRVNPDGSLKENIEEPAEQAAEPVEPEAEEPQAEAAAEPAPSPEEETAEPAAEAPGEELPAPNVYETLQFALSLLTEQAWQFMGLHLPPGRKEPIRDMAQAKLAIDTVIFISDKLHPHLDEEGRKAIRSLISDLQLNFVQHGQA